MQIPAAVTRAKMLVNWEVVKSREVYYTENSSDLHLF